MSTKLQQEKELLTQNFQQEKEVSIQFKQQLQQERELLAQIKQELQLQKEQTAQLQQQLLQEKKLSTQVQQALQNNTDLLAKTHQNLLEERGLVAEVKQELQEEKKKSAQLQQEKWLLAHFQQQYQKEKEVLAKLQQQLSTTEAKNKSLLAAQQEAIAFGIEPWKVPRVDVEVGCIIGGGGWGSVHKGKLQVAVKQFYPNILSKQNLGRLKREMQMLALIRHPNLVQFIAAVFDENADHEQSPPYIITELLDMSLRSAYEKELIPHKNLVLIFQDVARALDYLHQRHEPIIHRDVSSANILLKRQSNDQWLAKLSDLGSANLAQEAYTMNEGSWVYCAPEAFTQGENTRSSGTLTPMVDVYSYGIVLCEVATSTFPDKMKFPFMLDRVRHEWPQLHQLITECTMPSPEQRLTMTNILTSLEKLSC